MVMFQNDENLPNTPDSDIDSPNTKNNKKNNSRQKNKTSGKKRNNNKRRRRNKRRRNSTRRNGRYLWYSVITMNDFLVSKLILFCLLKWKIFILIQQLVHANTKKNCVF